ncbi:hypothetical protein [Natrinema salinisoli]|uniref:hypothetical protein n=1 Tax=Natrinema salinisoli TaxID=2878535 RepID=UPI001CF08564|nr:hypothetical protein [Natrinema salinisoli]
MIGEDETVDETFFERNQAVFLLLAVLQDRGHMVGYRVDEDPAWPVVFAETPEGQIAWHVPRNELPDWLKERDVAWDGHSTKEKHERMEQFAESLVAAADTGSERFDVEAFDDGYIRIDDANSTSVISATWCQEEDAVQLANQIIGVVQNGDIGAD